MVTETEYMAIILSIEVAVYCAIISLPLALLIGYIMARKSFKAKIFVEGILNLPLVMPPVTTGFILLILLGRNGFIGRYLYEWFGVSFAFSFSAAVIAALTVSFPLFVRAVRTAIEMVDKDLEEASYTLGKSKFATFSKITFPLALPGIVSGFILSFARSLGEFGATITFAGNIVGETQTLPLAIYSYMQEPGKESSALFLVIISVSISLLAMLGAEFLQHMHKQKVKTSQL
ncbi:MAG: molybdate ABC transporter permease subunit [Bacteroidota bacterium]